MRPRSHSRQVGRGGMLHDGGVQRPGRGRCDVQMGRAKAARSGRGRQAGGLGDGRAGPDRRCMTRRTTMTMTMMSRIECRRNDDRMMRARAMMVMIGERLIPAIVVVRVTVMVSMSVSPD